jgi:hypothetical protein
LFKHTNKLTGLVAALTVAATAFGAQALTASNTVPATTAGSGSGAITGYTVSNIAYTYSPDGTKITKAEFNLNSAASNVKSSLIAAPSTADWTDCNASAAVTHLVTCTYGAGVLVGEAVNLSVIAVSSGTATVAAAA